MDEEGGTGGGIADDEDGKGVGAEEREARRALNASLAFAVLRALREVRGGICGTGAGSRMNGLEFERNCVRVGG